MSEIRKSYTWKPTGKPVSQEEPTTKNNFADKFITMKETDINYDFMMQMMRPVELLPDAPYAKPWLFAFENGAFVAVEKPSLNYEKITIEAKDFESTVKYYLPYKSQTNNDN